MIQYVLTYILCELIKHYFLTETGCLSVEQNYTLFQNGTWEISRQCGSVLATCNSDGSWSENISCPEISTYHTDGKITILTDIIITYDYFRPYRCSN